MSGPLGALALALTLVTAAPALAAQSPVPPEPPAGVQSEARTATQPDSQGELLLSGVVIDENGAPAAGVPVALHRITDVGGSLVENTESDETGRFQMRIAAAAVDAVYFVAARYRDEMYIGPTFRGPFPDAADYVVQVGIEEASASALIRGGEVTVGPPPSAWRWALFAVIASAFLLVALLLLRRAFGPAPRRRLLIRIARLDETMAAVDDAEAREAYRTQRERLFERLRTAE